MKSFTASTRIGPCKVVFGDNGPRVMHNGRVIVEAVPTSEDGTLVFPTDSEPLVCVPTGERKDRVAKTIQRSPEAEVREDVAVDHIRGRFTPDGMPALWGCRLDEKAKRVTGFTFEDGVAVLEVWAVDLVAVKRKCCGRS